MNRRILLIIIGAIVLIGLSGAAFFLVQRSPALQNSVFRLANTAPPANENQPVAVTPLNTNAAVSADTAAIQYVARNFAELYGSGTSQNNFENIEQAKQWGTENFNSFLNRLIAQGRAKGAATTFQRTISTALVIKITKQAATSASITVSLQREDSGDSGEKTYYQDLYLDLVKQGKDWKVNAASWQVL